VELPALNVGSVTIPLIHTSSNNVWILSQNMKLMFVGADADARHVLGGGGECKHKLQLHQMRSELLCFTMPAMTPAASLMPPPALVTQADTRGLF